MAELGILTVLAGAAAAGDDGRIVVTRKFLEGLERYRQAWPGQMRVVVPTASRVSDDLDNVAVDPRELPYELSLCALDGPDLGRRIAGSAVMLGGPDYRMPQLVPLARSLGVPVVHNTEYSLKTRLQIARANGERPLRRFKHALWEINQERLILQGLLGAAGVQCNGTPTYDLYRHVARNPLLYFDTRTDSDLFATHDELAAREQRLASGAPLTLAFSGRLIPMKGADHLLDVAAALKKHRFPFRLLIAGEGTSSAAMRERIARDGLSEVSLLGVLPFRDGLMPLVRREVDVFVALHRQGDPSCTYLETLACGVPIVGYANEAFAGLLKRADVGSSAPVDQPARVAELLMRLSRAELARKGRNGLAFAREHAFEATFARRVAHLVSVAEEHKRRGGAFA